LQNGQDHFPSAGPAFRAGHQINSNEFKPFQMISNEFKPLFKKIVCASRIRLRSATARQAGHQPPRRQGRQGAKPKI
jgi:hypothetical protein